MKKFVKVMVACAVALSVLPSVSLAQAKKFNVGYTNLADTDVFTMARKNAFIAASKKDADVRITFSDAQGDISKQLDQIDNFIAQKVNAIVVVPVDYQGIEIGRAHV